VTHTSPERIEMKSNKSVSLFQGRSRRLKVVVTRPVYLVHKGEKFHIWAFGVWALDGKNYDVWIDYKLYKRRMELFRAGHRLVLVVKTDDYTPVIYAVDAWFDRDRPRSEVEAK
jgi:hypothetical protein